jgi:hypothetical protein
MRKLLAMAGIGTLSLVLGVPVVWAQEEKPKDELKQEEPKQDAAPKTKEDKATKDESKKTEKEERQQDKTQTQTTTQQQEKTQQQTSTQQAAAPSGKGGHIPDNKFRANFGRQHTFVIKQTTIVQGQTGFVYGGYSFVIAEGWPAGWAYTDDCYIDYIDGEYFLFDLLHPGVQIMLVVVM